MGTSYLAIGRNRSCSFKSKSASSAELLDIVKWGGILKWEWKRNKQIEWRKWVSNSPLDSHSDRGGLLLMQKGKMLVMARQDGEGESYPAFAIWGHHMERESFMVRCWCQWREKSDDKEKEAKEEDWRKVILCRHSGVWIIDWLGSWGGGARQGWIQRLLYLKDFIEVYTL